MLVIGLNKTLGSTGIPTLGFTVLLGRDEQHTLRVLLNSEWYRNPKYGDLEHHVRKGGPGSVRKRLSHY